MIDAVPDNLNILFLAGSLADTPSISGHRRSLVSMFTIEFDRPGNGRHAKHCQRMSILCEYHGRTAARQAATLSKGDEIFIMATLELSQKSGSSQNGRVMARAVVNRLVAGEALNDERLPR